MPFLFELMLVLCCTLRIKRLHVKYMLLWVFVINSVLVCAITSLGQCAVSDGVPYISELILLCKRGGQAFVPWLSFGAFVAVVVIQLFWMERVARVWRRRCTYVCTTTGSGNHFDVGLPDMSAIQTRHEGEIGRLLFLALAVAALVGFGFVVRFDWRDTSVMEIKMHRAGVVLLAFGGFGALQVIWVILRDGDNVARLRGEVNGYIVARDVPWLSWVEVDVLFLVVLVVFMVTTLMGGHGALSAVFEYMAFALLLGQTTWLFILCWERERWRRGLNVDIDGARASKLLWLLLSAYTAEAALVLVVVL